jgi:hypothetical protein
MVLKATNAIPMRVIGYRDGQRVQRTDLLLKGDTLMLTDVPTPEGQVTVWCEMKIGECAAGFKITGEAARIEELIRVHIWTNFHIEDALYWVSSRDRPFLTPMTEIGDHEIVIAKDRLITQYLKHLDNAEVIRTVEVQMDRETFVCTAPIQSQERMIRTTLRSHYHRTDSTYVLKMGVCLCTLRQIEAGSRKVSVITTGPGGAPDPPEGHIRTKYRIADGAEQEIYADSKARLEEVGDLIRERHGIKCWIIIKQDNAERRTGRLDGQD